MANFLGGLMELQLIVANDTRTARMDPQFQLVTLELI
jgi:hypothetical protein